MLGTYLLDKVFSYILSERTLHYLEKNQKSFQPSIQRAIQKRIDSIKLDTEVNPNIQLQEYSRQEKVISIRKLEIKYPNQLYWCYGLYGACQGGHQDLVELMIEKGATSFNLGLHGACEGGHRDLVELMIQKGATLFNHGLHGVCQGEGHRDLAILMIEKGADNFNWGLEVACKGGHRDLVELLIQKGATFFNLGLNGACQGGHRDLVELMIQKGATRCNYCRKSIAEHLKI